MACDVLLSRVYPLWILSRRCPNVHILDQNWLNWDGVILSYILFYFFDKYSIYRPLIREILTFNINSWSLNPEFRNMSCQAVDRGPYSTLLQTDSFSDGPTLISPWIFSFILPSLILCPSGQLITNLAVPLRDLRISRAQRLFKCTFVV